MDHGVSLVDCNATPWKETSCEALFRVSASNCGGPCVDALHLVRCQASSATCCDFFSGGMRVAQSTRVSLGGKKRRKRLAAQAQCDGVQQLLLSPSVSFHRVL